MSKNSEGSSQDIGDSEKENAVPQLEVDQTIAPRPEEEIADALRSEPDAEVPTEE